MEIEKYHWSQAFCELSQFFFFLDKPAKDTENDIQPTNFISSHYKFLHDQNRLKSYIFNIIQNSKLLLEIISKHLPRNSLRFIEMT